MKIKKAILILLLLIGTAHSNSLNIHSDYNKTIKIAKKEDKPIFIFFFKDNCQWCEKLKAKLLTSKEIYQKLYKDYIVLFLDRDRDNYPKKRFKIDVTPTVILMSPSEEIYTQIVGYHAKDKDYLKWFNYVQVEREN
jgi:thioredoxin-related protein